MSQVCRFYLNGNCRFGDRCRYSHNLPESNYGSGFSPPNPYVLNRTQNYNEPKQNWKQNISYNDVQELIEKIRDEAKQVEHENLWPLTCLSVMREGANVPGWEDFSMEEIRTAAYSAKLTNRFDEYTRFYQNLIQKAKEARSIFLRPGKRAEETVRLMVENRKDESQPSSSFSFAQVPAFSGFNSTASTVTSTSGAGSIFGGSQASKAGSPFGSTPFGSGTGTSAPGIFAMAAQGFASNVSQGSVLSDTDMETASESLLNQSSSSGVSPLHQNIFGQVAQQSGFPSQGTSSAFGSPPTTTASGFGGNTATPGVFGGSAAKNTSNPSVFSGPFGAGSGNSSNVFSGAPASSPFSANQGTSEVNYDDSVYTPMSELSESDLEQFKAATFTLSKLPLVPPPKELC